jgi:hypothetical protein
MQKGAHGVMVIAFTHQASNPYNNMYISRDIHITYILHTY